MQLTMNRHLRFHGKVRRFNHNLSYHNFFSGEIGELRPVYLEDMVPGDTFQYRPELRLYFAPLVFPVLSTMKARIDLFFCPNRLAWNSWENFYTGGPDNSLHPNYPSVRNIIDSLSGAQKTAFVSWVNASAASHNSLLNNLGHPYLVNPVLTTDPYDMTPTYDYRFIFDEYYRDEEKEQSVTGYGGIHRDIYEVFGTSAISSLFYSDFASGNMPSIAWAKDYFTTASLEQQRGGDIPLLSNPMFQTASGNSGLDGSAELEFDPSNDWEADLVDQNQEPLESVLTINGLRYLYAASSWLNNNVIGGTRYIEMLRTRYKVVSSDARLQRPEMVGSISLPVSVDVVTQTSSTVDSGDELQALGDRAGKAAVIGAGKTLTYSAEEFGYLIGILHIAPKPAYFQGIRYNLQREDKFDFFMPEFQGVPQRPIRNNEIFAVGTDMSPENCGTFGYTGQYNEYRFHNDEVHGDFQDSLLAWTMARKFSSLPSVSSSSFLRVDHDTQGNNRIFAVPDSEFAHIFGVVNNIVLAKREIVNREPHF